MMEQKTTMIYDDINLVSRDKHPGVTRLIRLMRFHVSYMYYYNHNNYVNLLRF